MSQTCIRRLPWARMQSQVKAEGATSDPGDSLRHLDQSWPMEYLPIGPASARPGDLDELFSDFETCTAALFFCAISAHLATGLCSLALTVGALPRLVLLFQSSRPCGGARRLAEVVSSLGKSATVYLWKHRGPIPEALLSLTDTVLNALLLRDTSISIPTGDMPIHLEAEPNIEPIDVQSLLPPDFAHLNPTVQHAGHLGAVKELQYWQADEALCVHNPHNYQVDPNTYHHIGIGEVFPAIPGFPPVFKLHDVPEPPPSSWHSEPSISPEDFHCPNPLFTSSAVTPETPFLSPPAISSAPLSHIEVETHIAAGVEVEQPLREDSYPVERRDDTRPSKVRKNTVTAKRPSKTRTKPTRAPKKSLTRTAKQPKALKDETSSTSAPNRANQDAEVPSIPPLPSSHIASSVPPTSPKPHDQRERNRAAATKCRQRTKAATAQLEETSRTESEVHTELLAEVARLKDEVLFYRAEILRHEDCECEVIRTYIKNAAVTIAETGGVWARWGPDGTGEPKAEAAFQGAI